jgi:hypothetical protein
MSEDKEEIEMSEGKQFVVFEFRGVVDGDKAKELLEAIADRPALLSAIRMERHVAIVGEENGSIKHDYAGPPCAKVDIWPDHVEQFMKLLREE